MLAHFLKSIVPNMCNLPIALLTLCSLFVSSWCATRLSSTHIIPDADMLKGGEYVIDAQGYYFSDSIGKPVIRPAAMARFGVIEWVNVEAGYAGGMTVGFKARLLNETNAFMPSLSIGAYNLFTHKEANLFNEKSDSLANEFYFALGKSIDPAKMRIHMGLQSIPTIKDEQLNPFFGIEKYFGIGLYVSLEAHRRNTQFVPSLFTSWRILKNKFELYGGVVDFLGLFTPNSEKGGGDNINFVKPGFSIGLRFNNMLSFKNGASSFTIEGQLSEQSVKIKSMEKQLDSLRSLMSISSSRMKIMDTTLANLTDSNKTEIGRLRTLVIDKLMALKALYVKEPFEPEIIKNLTQEIVGYREVIVPILQEIIADKKYERKVRTLAISILGEIGNGSASDILIDLLGQTDDSDIRVEVLIALGKLKETRAVYLVKELTNDTDDAVAFTANEVLQKLIKETGIVLSKSNFSDEEPTSIPETKIGTKKGAIEAPNYKFPKRESDKEITSDDWDTDDKAESKIKETTILPSDGEKKNLSDKNSKKDGVVDKKKSEKIDTKKDEHKSSKEKVEKSAENQKKSMSKDVEFDDDW